jgi:hypothetical protein
MSQDVPTCVKLINSEFDLDLVMTLRSMPCQHSGLFDRVSSISIWRSI